MFGIGEADLLFLFFFFWVEYLLTWLSTAVLKSSFACTLLCICILSRYCTCSGWQRFLHILDMTWCSLDGMVNVTSYLVISFHLLREAPYKMQGLPFDASDSISWYNPELDCIVFDSVVLLPQNPVHNGADVQYIRFFRG